MMTVNVIVICEQVNVDTFTIDDLVREAVSTNDVFSLLASIRQRWMKHCRLAAEIEPLRHKYLLITVTDPI